MDLPDSDVPRCTSTTAKTLGLKHLQLPDTGANSGLPDGARLVHYGTDELLIEQGSIPEGQTTLPVQEGTQHTQPLGSFLPFLIDMRRPGQPCINGHPRILGCSTARGFWMGQPALAKSTAVRTWPQS